jgi:hypothetical protein
LGKWWGSIRIYYSDRGSLIYPISCLQMGGQKLRRSPTIVPGEGAAGTAGRHDDVPVPTLNRRQSGGVGQNLNPHPKAHHPPLPFHFTVSVSNRCGTMQARGASLIAGDFSRWHAEGVSMISAVLPLLHTSGIFLHRGSRFDADFWRSRLHP